VSVLYPCAIGYGNVRLRATNECCAGTGPGERDGGSGGSPEPPGRLLTHLHTVCMSILAITYRIFLIFEPRD
jgi:hypothetical protein